MAGAGTPDSHLDLAGKELVSSYMHFHVTPAENQSSLVLPREGRGTSQLSVRGTGRGWQILQLIHEMQNRGMLYKPDCNRKGLRWESGAEQKGLIVACGLSQTPWPLWEWLEGKLKSFHT